MAIEEFREKFYPQLSTEIGLELQLFLVNQIKIQIVLDKV